MAAGSLFVMRACALVLLLLLLLLLHNGVDALSAASTRRRLDAHLGAAAAPPHRGTVRNIQSPDGDIVDCILSEYQPALQHPLLKNHTIQELPSSVQVDGNTTHKTHDQISIYEVFQVWHENDRCPFGTIPILRNDPLKPVHKKNGSYPIKNKEKIHGTLSNHEYATAYYQSTNNSIYGASVILNQWNPLVESKNELSLSQMWISAGKFEGTDLNTIEVGWQDPKTQNWWLRYGKQHLGYWPKEIFTHLANYGNMVQWGGEVVNNSPQGSHTSTQMGSGHFAKEGYRGACYARGLARIDSTNKLWNISSQDLTTFATNPSCYDVELKSFTNWDSILFFGGPGKNPHCP